MVVCTILAGALILEKVGIRQAYVGQPNILVPFALSMKSLLLWYQIWQQIILKREEETEESLASSLLNIICHQNWYQSKSDNMDRA